MVLSGRFRLIVKAGRWKHWLKLLILCRPSQIISSPIPSGCVRRMSGIRRSLRGFFAAVEIQPSHQFLEQRDFVGQGPSPGPGDPDPGSESTSLVTFLDPHVSGFVQGLQMAGQVAVGQVQGVLGNPELGPIRLGEHGKYAQAGRFRPDAASGASCQPPLAD